MVPRIHERGTSFKEACNYILHDRGKKTRDRVAWVKTQNLGHASHELAWALMHDTWMNRTALKIKAGVPTTGRDNKAPVLHYTLSWHADDNPTPEHMQKAAYESLKVLGLGEHEALIAAHTDTDHPHVHIVANTVHPETGKTAALKYSKEKFSRWAEAYEREHGIRCQERIINNERRRQAREARKLDPSVVLMAASGIEPPARKPYVPVKHKAVSRKAWFEKKQITERMKAMRSSLDGELKAARDLTWARHSKERDALDKKTKSAIDVGRKQINDVYRPQWRNLYWNQGKEARYVERLSGNLLERAVYVFQNRDRLGGVKGPLTLREMLPLITSPKKLRKRVAQMHDGERRELAREVKTETKAMSEQAWRRHRQEFNVLRERQTGERQSERGAQSLRRKTVSFALAKAALIKEHEAAQPAPEPRAFKYEPALSPLQKSFQEVADPPPPEPAPEAERVFNQVANDNAQPALSRAEQIRRGMAEWRKRNQGLDFGREI